MAADPASMELEALRQRLEEAEETLRAIRNGEVDALVVNGLDGERIFTLQGADHPYRALIESMQQGAAVLSVEGIILYGNARFAEMAGRPLERVIGASVVEFLPQAQRQAFQRLLRRSSGRGEFQFETGSIPLPIYLAISSLALNGQTSLCMVVTDLTEQKEHQGLREVNRRKDEFLAMLAHELRNPLAPIRNALYLLKRAEIDLTTSDDVRSMMERQVEHLARLIDDLMDVSRISTGKIEIRLDVVDLVSVVVRAVEVCRSLIDQKRHEFILNLPSEPILVEVDPTRLEQIFDNLLTNAAKYTDPGGHIALSVIRENETVIIRLVDDGIGIAREKLARIFDLFVQAERRLDRSQGGLGLGLSLVKSLVEIQGGTVTASSPGLGRGSEFVVRLPVKSSVPSRTSSNPIGPAELGPAICRPCRILVVDDNEDSARSMATILKRLWKQTTDLAHDGFEALERAEKFLPEIILLDIGLPGMSGYEVAERLRVHPLFEKTLLVAMTGLGQDEDILHSRRSGFDHHLVKPVDLDILQGLIASIAGRRATDEELDLQTT